MNKTEFIDRLAERTRMTRTAAADVVHAIFDSAGGLISEAVDTAGHLSIPGFGKFSKRSRPARTGRNPRTGATIDVPASTTVAFQAGKGLKNRGEGGAAQPAAAKKSAAAGGAKKSAAKAGAGASGGAAAETGGGAKKLAGGAKKAAGAKKSAGGKGGKST